jgi:hypothetical protein
MMMMMDIGGELMATHGSRNVNSCQTADAQSLHLCSCIMPKVQILRVSHWLTRLEFTFLEAEIKSPT